MGEGTLEVGAGEEQDNNVNGMHTRRGVWNLSGDSGSPGPL